MYEYLIDVIWSVSRSVSSLIGVRGQGHPERENTPPPRSVYHFVYPFCRSSLSLPHRLTPRHGIKDGYSDSRPHHPTGSGTVRPWSSNETKRLGSLVGHPCFQFTRSVTGVSRMSRDSGHPVRGGREAYWLSDVGSDRRGGRTEYGRWTLTAGFRTRTETKVPLGLVLCPTLHNPSFISSFPPPRR